MTEEPPHRGITIAESGDRVVIEVPGGKWEGSATEAERLLTRLHYVLGRARPGTNIASLFINGELWGAKSIETDPRRAVQDMRILVDQLATFVARQEEALAKAEPSD